MSADPFVEGAYASVKGQVRTFVLHAQLLRHLPDPPGRVLDVGGAAAHQSLPLARLGFDVTVLDPSPAMLAKAEQRLSAEPKEVRRRVRLVEAPGEQAEAAIAGQRFAAVLCHGRGDVPRAARIADRGVVPLHAAGRGRVGDGAERPHPGGPPPSRSVADNR